MTAGALLSMTSGKKIGNRTAVPKGPDIQFVKELLEAGKIVPVIDRTYPLAGVPAAIRYLEQEHARGKLVITASRLAPEAQRPLRAARIPPRGPGRYTAGRFLRVFVMLPVERVRVQHHEVGACRPRRCPIRGNPRIRALVPW